MDTKTYVVTELAGPKVAGVSVTKGSELELTENEARYELLSGSIVEKGKDLHRAFTESTPKTEKALEAAVPPTPVDPDQDAQQPAAAKPGKGSRPA